MALNWQAMILDQELFDKFIWFIEEREHIRRLKEKGIPWPWTSDKLLQTYIFTNVWRQDDRTTKAIQGRLAGTHDILDIIMNAIWLRSLKKIETINAVPLLFHYSYEEIWAKKVDTSIIKFGNAYVTVPSWELEKGTRRIDAIKAFLDGLHEKFLNAGPNRSWESLKPFLEPEYWFRGLPRYEVFLDIWQRLRIEEEFTNVGPGAAWTLTSLLGKENPGEDQIRELLEYVKERLPLLEHPIWGELTLRCIEGMCCEFRKYCMLESNPKAHKRYYVRETFETSSQEQFGY